jgi:hypothetical protein
MGDRIHETTLLSTSEPGKGFAVRNMTGTSLQGAQ